MTRPPIEAPCCRTCGGDAWFPPEGDRTFGTVCEDCLGSGASLRDPRGWAYRLGELAAVAFVLLLIYGACETLSRAFGVH